MELDELDKEGESSFSWRKGKKKVKIKFQIRRQIDQFLGNAPYLRRQRTLRDELSPARLMLAIKKVRVFSWLEEEEGRSKSNCYQWGFYSASMHIYGSRMKMDR